MEALFLKILNLSIIAGWITLAIVILRPLLKKAPKAITVALWALVAIRLLFPLSIESVISLIPSAETVPPEIIYVEEPAIDSGITYANTIINPTISESLAPAPEASVNPMQILVSVASVIWVVGMIAMALYAAVSYLRIRLKVRASIPMGERIRICDEIPSPFILGILRPRIYLPSDLEESQKAHVIAHEEAHLRRKDHWWKPLGFALLTVYWFHPLLWVAYILLCRDIELACDERVIKSMEPQEKAAYSKALLSCSAPRRMISACPLAFGEVGVKKRIKAILHYKKPAFWFVILAVVICVVCTGCLLTDPLKEKIEEELSTQKPVTTYTPNSDYSMGKKLYCDDSVKNTHIVFPADYDLENNQLYIMQTQKQLVGQLKVFELTKENFDDLFVSQNWYFGDSAQKIRENNETAWQIISPNDDSKLPPQYLLRQKDSDILLLVYFMDSPEGSDQPLIVEHIYQLVPNIEGQPSSYEQIIQDFLNGNLDQLRSLHFSNTEASAYSGYVFYIETNQTCTMSTKRPPYSSIIGPIVRFDYVWNQEKILASKDGVLIFTLTPTGNGFVFEKVKTISGEIDASFGGSSFNLPSDGTFFVLNSVSYQ